MTPSRTRAAALTGVLVAAALAVSACGSSTSKTNAAGSTAGTRNAATATSAADLGGMDALVAAAKKEGTLNAIALPRDWANYGAIMDGFTKKYGIKINDENPEGSSQDEINAVTTRTKAQMKEMSPAALDKLTLLGMSPLILGQMTGQLSKLPPFFNLVISNVVGSREKLYFRGAQMEAIYPISVLFDGYALNATIVGYADHISLGYTGCRNALPRLQRLAVYSGEALVEMEQAYGLASPAKTKATRKPRQAKT